jgi:hypothetical protein
MKIRSKNPTGKYVDLLIVIIDEQFYLSVFRNFRKILDEQKISRAVISPELLKKNLKVPLLKQPAVARKILRLLSLSNGNSKTKGKK